MTLHQSAEILAHQEAAWNSTIFSCLVRNSGFTVTSEKGQGQLKVLSFLVAVKIQLASASLTIRELPDYTDHDWENFSPQEWVQIYCQY